MFLTRLRAAFPEKVSKVEHHLRETHGGHLKLAGFGERMRGKGNMAEAIEDLFRVHAKRQGLEEDRMERAAMDGGRAIPAASNRRNQPLQTDLFGS